MSVISTNPSFFANLSFGRKNWLFCDTTKGADASKMPHPFRRAAWEDLTVEVCL